MKHEFSAGGVVYKKDNGKVFILVAQHSYHHGWVFPKGLIGDSIENESKEQTAVREVQEETGATAKIIKPLTPVTFWYVWGKEKIKKTVYYYIMEYISGDITEHDTEMENVEWVKYDEVEKKLTYKSDKQVWKETKLLLSSQTKNLKH